MKPKKSAMKKTIPYFLILIFSFRTALCDEPSLYQKALKENEYPPAAISSSNQKDVITLVDTFDKRPARSWLWLFGASVENFAAEGSTPNPLGSEQSLSAAPSVLMPRISLGSRWQQDRFFTQLSLTGAFARQSMTLATANQGITADISTTSFSIRPALGSNYKKFEFSGFIDRGESFATVTSNSMLPRSTQTKQFLGYGVSAGYAFNKVWTGHVSALANTIKATSLEVGTSVLW